MSSEFLKIVFVILLLAPLAGFLVNGLRFRSSHILSSGIIGNLGPLISFFSVLILSIPFFLKGTQSMSFHFWDWMSVGALKIPFAFVVDPISLLMGFVITGVGSLIHIFSISYMGHDKRPAKYFSYLNFFLFHMLILVFADNLPLMFLGWEGVGLCSYLLIGFWFLDHQKAAAGMKAFVVNRIGDAGFLIGIFLLWTHVGTLDFVGLNESAPQTALLSWTHPLTLACLFLFIGATGKSAQIPLYVWLPDAMAGPTPVSALIHAATMVTAGVYMIVRLNPVFIAAPHALEVIATVGALTAFFAATIGMTQWDIKKILAYSTVSQLGYMFLAVGVGAFSSGLFHLFTHAFFKALLFLGAGSLIHALGGEQDIRKMGGLRKHMPYTYWTFIFGWLALIGIPPFAGFFSKDEILWWAWASPYGHPLLWYIGFVTALLTAFYMTRLMVLVFWGKPSFAKKPHKAPWLMRLPLLSLALASLLAGWVGLPHIFPGHPPHLLSNWLHPVLKSLEAQEGSAFLESIFMFLSVLGVLFTVYIAASFYLGKQHVLKKITTRWRGFYDWSYHKYWVDEFYRDRIVKPVMNISLSLWAHVDIGFIDQGLHKLGGLFVHWGRFVRFLQSGKTHIYVFYLTIGATVILSWILKG